MTRERNPKLRRPWIDYMRERWTKSHFRERNAYEIGRAQAKVAGSYRMRKDGDYDDAEFIKYILLDYILRGFDPLIFERPRIFEGARKWCEEVLAMPRDQVSEEDRIEAETLLREFNEGLVDRLPLSKEEKDARMAVYEAESAEFRRELEERRARRTPEEVERDRLEEEERRREEEEGERQNQELRENPMAYFRKVLEQLESKPDPSELELEAITDLRKLLAEHDKKMAEFKEASMNPPKEVITTYLAHRNFALEPEISEEERRGYLEFLAERAESYPPLSGMVKDVSVMLKCPGVEEWSKFEYETIKFSFSRSGWESESIPMEIPPNGIIRFAYFVDGLVEVKVEPSSDFPFSGEAKWDLSETGNKTLFLELKPRPPGKR